MTLTLKIPHRKVTLFLPEMYHQTKVVDKLRQLFKGYKIDKHVIMNSNHCTLTVLITLIYQLGLLGKNSEFEKRQDGQILTDNLNPFCDLDHEEL